MKKITSSSTQNERNKFHEKETNTKHIAIVYLFKDTQKVLIRNEIKIIQTFFKDFTQHFLMFLKCFLKMYFHANSDLKLFHKMFLLYKAL